MIARWRRWFICQRIRRELDALSRRLDRLEADVTALHERLET